MHKKDICLLAKPHIIFSYLRTSVLWNMENIMPQLENAVVWD